MKKSDQNGIFKSGDKFYWRFFGEVGKKSRTRSAVERDYINRLLASDYKSLLEGRTYDRQHAIVFGAKQGGAT